MFPYDRSTLSLHHGPTSSLPPTHYLRTQPADLTTDDRLHQPRQQRRIHHPASSRERQLPQSHLTGGCFLCVEKPFDDISSMVSMYLRLHERHQGKSHLPRSFRWRHRPYRIGANHLRPHQSQIRNAAQNLLAEYQST
jgi:hypothetical protein